MDVNDLRIAVTVVSLGCFIGIIKWAWSRHNQPSFDEAALIPFTNDESAPVANGRAVQ
jgi:cytochrome c oxidase cbb3-type subunit 4